MDGSGGSQASGHGPPGRARPSFENFWSGGKFHIADLPLLMITVGFVTGALIICIVMIILIIAQKCRQRRRDETDVKSKHRDDEGSKLDTRRESTGSRMSSILLALQAKKMFASFDKETKEQQEQNAHTEKKGQTDNTKQKISETSERQERLKDRQASSFDGQEKALEAEHRERTFQAPILLQSAGLIGLTIPEQDEELEDSSAILVSQEECDEGGMEVPQYGRLWFSVVYNDVTQKLFIRVIKAKYLKSRDKNKPLGTPFVKVFLLPDEFNLQESRMLENSSAPHFDQTFEFINIRSDMLRMKTVRISVYDIDTRRVRHAHGHVIFPLDGYDVASGVVIWRDLEPDENLPSAVKCGELKISLTHEVLSQTLIVSLWEGRNMQNSEYFGRNHTVEIQLKLGDRVIQSMTTTSRPLTSYIQYDDEKFILSIPLDQLKSCSLVLLLSVEPPGASDLLTEGGGASLELGKLVLGLETYSQGSGAEHWQEVMSNPRQTTTRWHCVLSSIQLSRHL